MKLPRPHKYRARQTEYAGELYPSAAEAAHAQRLDLLKRGGKIHGWRRGRPIVLVEGETRRKTIRYCPDFLVTNLDGTTVAIDVKGVVTREFRMKAILWEKKFPRTPLMIVDARGRQKPALDYTAPKRRAVNARP